MLLDLMQARRSVRKFQGDKITALQEKALADALLLSPTSKNKRCTDFIFVKDKDKLLKLSEVKPKGGQFLKTAALGVVILGDSFKSDVWVEDCAIASANFMLMAEELALGCCYCQIRKRWNDENATISAETVIKKLLDIPENYSVLAIMAVGEKGEFPEKKILQREDYKRIHSEKF